MRAIVLIFQFLTRLPMPWQVEADEKTFARGIYYFTVVGAALGALLVAAEALLTALYLDDWSKAILLTLIHLMATGGLHLDGVADTSDALFSNRSRDRMLEILRDSRIGSNGVLALIVVLSLKAVAIHFALVQHSQWALLAMPMVGRFGVVLAFYWGRSPRRAGMGNLFIGRAQLRHIIANALPLVGLLSLAGGAWLALFGGLFISCLFVGLVIVWSNRKIGGITGDLLGFIIEFSEVVFLLTLVPIVALGGLL